jgi:hypothetical protein
VRVRERRGSDASNRSSTRLLGTGGVLAGEEALARIANSRNGGQHGLWHSTRDAIRAPPRIFLYNTFTGKCVCALVSSAMLLTGSWPDCIRIGLDSLESRHKVGMRALKETRLTSFGWICSRMRSSTC